MRTKTVGWRRGAAGFAAAAAVAVAALAVLLLTTGAGGSGDGYAVRAVFDNASNVTEGEDVKIDGAKVGTVGAIEATPQGKAAVTLEIETPGFQDFRADASCTIRPQSLLGEVYVDCKPTQPREEGAPLPPPLKKIPSGRPGAGDRLLPVSNTSSPVGVDQLQDMTRLPEAQRLRIILNELGAAFAGRGSELHEVIRRANPGLRELEKVLGILAGQNHVLADLAVESDKVLAPFAAAREDVKGFVEHSNAIAQASDRHLAAVEEGLSELPAFLRQLGPAMRRIDGLARQTTPTMEALNTAAPGLDRAFESLPGFSSSTTAYLESLGKTAKTTGPALRGSEQLLNRLEPLGSAAKPFATKAAELLKSLKETGGLERIMDFIYLGAGATNGYDKLGHFLRAEVASDRCVNYSTSPPSGCTATFRESEKSNSATASAASAQGVIAKRTIAVLEGATPAQAIAEFPGGEGEEAPVPGAGAGAQKATATPVGGAASKTTYYTPGAEPAGISERLLEYLLGG